MSTPITSADVSKMLSLLGDQRVVIISRAQIEGKTSCDLYELLELTGIDQIAFGKYRRSKVGKMKLTSFQ